MFDQQGHDIDQPHRLPGPRSICRGGRPPWNFRGGGPGFDGRSWCASPQLNHVSESDTCELPSQQDRLGEPRRKWRGC
jgi:hypothetical protein